ncbi:MAG: DUF11 domain-containing protein [Oscillospiraceae bacterium]|nr:DUF11 domain-containing protein [Oscillospiraceae bacterium]
MERFYHGTNNCDRCEDRGYSDDYYNSFDNYGEDFANYYTSANNNAGYGNSGGNVNVNNNGSGGNSRCSITNTATAQGYIAGTATTDHSIVTGEDSITLGCIMADIEKTADLETASAGDRIKYTITFRNMSDRDMYNVKITDQLPRYLDVIATSITPFPQQGENLETGVTLGRVPAGASRTLVFSATVTNDVSEDIVNRAFADFNFRDSDGREQSASTPITSVTTTVENTGITVEKTANKNYVTSNGEVVEFTIKVTNNSSRGVSDLVVTDNLPDKLRYVENSTSINGANPINADPADGIYIGNLRSGAAVTVKFNVTVNI